MLNGQSAKSNQELTTARVEKLEMQKMYRFVRLLSTRMFVKFRLLKLFRWLPERGLIKGQVISKATSCKTNRLLLEVEDKLVDCSLTQYPKNIYKMLACNRIELIIKEPHQAEKVLVW